MEVNGEFAAFLSHYKDESGPEARILKSRLLEFRVDAGEIFLDSDNLSDLSELKQHVQNSDAIVILFTECIFERPWCLVEMVTAVREQIPIIFYVLLAQHVATQHNPYLTYILIRKIREHRLC